MCLTYTCRLTYGFSPALWGNSLLHASPVAHACPLTFLFWTLDAKGDDCSAFEFEALVSQRGLFYLFAPRKTVVEWLTEPSNIVSVLWNAQDSPQQVSVCVGTLLSQVVWTQGPCVVVEFFYLSFWKWKTLYWLENGGLEPRRYVPETMQRSQCLDWRWLWRVSACWDWQLKTKWSK